MGLLAGLIRSKVTNDFKSTSEAASGSVTKAHQHPHHNHDHHHKSSKYMTMDSHHRRLQLKIEDISAELRSANLALHVRFNSSYIAFSYHKLRSTRNFRTATRSL